MNVITEIKHFLYSGFEQTRRLKHLVQDQYPTSYLFISNLNLFFAVAIESRGVFLASKHRVYSCVLNEERVQPMNY